nr:hypothetical protein [Tanacetum cinerariifolium]
MRRASKGYKGVDIPLFPTKLVQGLYGKGSTVPVPTPPHDSPPPEGHKPGSDDGSLTLKELTVMCTTLSNKVKKLEKTVKTSQARRRAKIVISEDDMVLEDSSKQGRMIEYIDQDAGVILITLTKVSSQEDQPEDQLGVPSVPTLPHDSPPPKGHTPRSDDGSLTLKELTVMCITLSNKVESLETNLKLTKQTYGAAFTKLIKKVKKLEKTIKTSQARRRAKIVISDDDMVSEDSSKQERMIEDIEQDARVILVTLTKDSSQEDQA